MNNQELSNLVATVVKGFTKVDDLTYQDKDGAVYYSVNYCESPSHALDLAMAEGIVIVPHNEQWQCFKAEEGSLQAVPDTISNDPLIGKAIVLACLKAHNQEV